MITITTKGNEVLIDSEIIYVLQPTEVLILYSKFGDDISTTAIHHYTDCFLGIQHKWLNVIAARVVRLEGVSPLFRFKETLR